MGNRFQCKRVQMKRRGGQDQIADTRPNSPIGNSSLSSKKMEKGQSRDSTEQQDS